MQKTTTKSNNWWMLFLAAFAVFFMLAVQNVAGVDFWAQLSFLAAQAGLVLIPGMALLLLVGPPGDKVRFGIAAYLLGMCMVVAEYFVFYAAGLRDIMWVPMAAVSALSVLGIWRKRGRLETLRSGGQGGWAFSVLLAALLLAVLFQAESLWNTPDVAGREFVPIYQDLTWNMGNVTAIANGLPVMDVHISGFTFGYHYLAAAFLAVFKNLLGLSSYVLYMKLMPALSAAVLSGGLYLLFSTLFQNKWACAGAAAAAALVCAMTVEHMQWYAFATPIGVGLSLAAAFFFFRYMKKMETAKGIDGDFLLFLIFLAVTAGTKAPFAVCLLAGPAAVFVVQIFRKKNVKQMLLAGVLTLAAFGAVYVALVFRTQTFNSFERAFAYEMVVEPPGYYTAALSGWGAGMAEGAVRAIVFPLYLLVKYTVVFAAVILLIVSLLRGKGRDKGVPVFLLAAVAAGAGAASLLAQPGLSNLFFMEAATPFAAFALFWAAADMGKNGLAKAGKIALAAVLCAVFAYSGWASVNRLAAGSMAEHSRGADEYNSISAAQYAGMAWMRDNTPKDAVFLSDRQYYSPQEDLNTARYYYYTAFSERTCYLEGYNYVSTATPDYEAVINDRLLTVRGIYDFGDEETIRQVKAEGVDYIVATKAFHPEFEMDAALGALVFENEGIAVWELRG